MPDIRESRFRCEFDSRSRRCVALVRAWDADEAIQLFEVELRDEGVSEAGEVVASPVSGGPLVRAHLGVRGH